MDRRSIPATSGAEIAVAHSLWVGGPLPPMAVACLKSFVTVGQRIVLHSYDRLDVPKGVELADASLTLPKEQIVIHRETGSYGVFSDIFRYQLLANGAELWVDCDVYCLKPIPRMDYFYGWENDKHIATGVLSLPADSELLKTMLAFARKPGVPVWLPRRHLPRTLLNQVIGRRGAEWLPWASIGPHALTHFARQLGKADLALPTDYLYPVAVPQLSRYLDPDLTIEDLVTSRTLALHFYKSGMSKQRKAIPPSSVLGRALAEVA